MRDIGFERFRIELIAMFPSKARHELEKEKMRYIKEVPNELLRNHKGNPRYEGKSPYEETREVLAILNRMLAEELTKA